VIFSCLIDSAVLRFARFAAHRLVVRTHVRDGTTRVLHRIHCHLHCCWVVAHTRFCLYTVYIYRTFLSYLGYFAIYLRTLRFCPCCHTFWLFARACTHPPPARTPRLPYTCAVLHAHTYLCLYTVGWRTFSWVIPVTPTTTQYIMVLPHRPTWLPAGCYYSSTCSTTTTTYLLFCCSSVTFRLSPTYFYPFLYAVPHCTCTLFGSTCLFVLRGSTLRMDLFCTVYAYLTPLPGLRNILVPDSIVTYRFCRYPARLTPPHTLRRPTTGVPQLH